MEKSSRIHTIYNQENDDTGKYKDDNRVDTILPPYGEYDKPRSTETFYNFTDEKMKALAKGSDDGKISYLEQVVHEMRHQYDFEIGNNLDSKSIPDKQQGTAKDPGEKIDPKKLQNPPNNLNIIKK